MKSLDDYSLNYKKELDSINKELLLKDLPFNRWNDYQQYFGNILYIQKFTIQYIYSFCCNLIYCKVNCATYNEKQELLMKKNNIKHFMNIISSPDYIKNYDSNKEIIGYLYKREILRVQNINIEDNDINNKIK